MDNLSQIETYEPTEADHEEASDYFARMEYEERVFEVTCKRCKCWDKGSQMFLEQAGWNLSRKGEYCSHCRTDTVKVKNRIPELLEALCTHAECPEWLKDDLWESFNNRGMDVSWSASFFRSQLESIGQKPTGNGHSNVVPFTIVPRTTEVAK